MADMTITVAVKLSGWIGVAGCRWHISMSVVRMTVSSWEFTKSATTSTSEYEEVTLHRMMEAV